MDEQFEAAHLRDGSWPEGTAGPKFSYVVVSPTQFPSFPVSGYGYYVAKLAETNKAKGTSVCQYNGEEARWENNLQMSS